MSTIIGKPRRVVTARRVLALGASAAMFGSPAGAVSVAAELSEPQGLIHQVEAEGEAAVEVEAEGEGDVGAEAAGEGGSAVDAEGEGKSAVEAEGEAATAGEGESEGGGSMLEPALTQARNLLVIDGLLRAAETQRQSGEDAAVLLEEAAEMAEHGLEGALANELYEQIEELETASDDQGFADLRERLAAARDEAMAADRLEAISLGLRAAGEHYAKAVSDGAVSDRAIYLEAFGIYEAVKAEADALAKSDEAAVAEVATEVRAQIEDAGAAFGGPAGEDIATPEASLLHAAAARVEFSALKLR